MHLKSLFAGCAAMLLASALSAQKPEYLPTSKDLVKVAGSQAPSPVSVAPALDPENTLNLDLSTGGRVVIQLRPDLAPKHVERVKALARKGFYNGIIFHRVIDGFMAQTGDPTGTGSGGSELPDVAAEFNELPHLRGVVSAARATDVNSANSQFFIMFAPRFSLDGEYTAFGRVVSGMQYVDTIERGEPPANPTRILQASIGADNVPPPAPGQATASVEPVKAPQAADRAIVKPQ
ncbi:MAG: peptidylprolyl isomerase [Pseudomonadota bacterium]|nr:peptidylprolyl isomerase [Pseudomonadota bacterium]